MYWKYWALRLSLQLLLYSYISQAKKHKPPFQISKRTCGTQQPSTDLLSTHQWLQQEEDIRDDLWNSSMIRDHLTRHALRSSHRERDSSSGLTRSDSATHPSNRVESRQFVPNNIFTVDTYIHIVADTANSKPGSSHYVTDDQIQAQFTYLNQAYANVGIAYTLRGTTRTVNDTWACNGDDQAMKKALRKGTYSALNIYYQTLLQDNDPSNAPFPGAFLLGFCTLPTSGITPRTSSTIYHPDGCNILSGTLPGSWQQGYNQGGTTVHEVGHWNGLLHTFQNNNCDVDDWGDFVADTPQEGSATIGCPLKKDTCPNSGINSTSYDPDLNPNPNSNSNPNTFQFGPQGYAGPDPINNFMDYSVDACYQGFTAGQGARMANMWVIYRQGN